jgi:hypothetical protein
MPNENRIRIKGWEKFQHYKNRKPPWIKLYRDLIDDMEFYSLSGDAAKTLILLWVIASEADGYLPDITVLAFRLRMDSKKCKSLLSELKHYLDSDVLAECLQDATPERERETERETETKEKAPKGAALHDLVVSEIKWPADCDQEVKGLFLEFLAERRDKRHYVTERAIAGLFRSLAGFTKSEQVEALNKAIAGGHQGLNPKKAFNFNKGNPVQNAATLPTTAELQAGEGVITNEDELPF